MEKVMYWASIAGIIVDLVILSALISSVYLGYKKGLVGVAFSIIATLASIVIVLFVYKPVAQLVIDRTDWDEKLTISIEDNLSGSAIDEEGNIIEDKDSSISETVTNFINKLVKEATDTAKSNIIGFVSGKLSVLMIRLGTMIVLFIVVRLILTLLQSVLEFIANLPLIRLFNKSGGIIYGVIRGFLIVYALLALFSLISPIFGNTGIIKAINDSHIGNIMYNNNIIVNFIMEK